MLEFLLIFAGMVALTCAGGLGIAALTLWVLRRRLEGRR